MKWIVTGAILGVLCGGVCALAFAYTVSAQGLPVAQSPDVKKIEPSPIPASDGVLVASWKLNIKQAEIAVNKADAALRRTSEYRELEDAKKTLESITAGVQKDAAARYPGFTLNIAAWNLVPLAR